ncbi:hypothetical protein DB346_02985 [Verrucomicrobia bacterium LW23]|nr:hypothetical protein DB346_03670 [Verrucomicrobia bacterium LW23]PTY04414.1 hypothetical protein DB346_02985 [Verrucomicrobia bacterium LW23]
MADESSLSINWQARKGINIQLNASYTRDIAGNNLLSAIQTIGTSAVAIAIGGASAAGHLALQNLGAYPIDVAIDSEAADAFATLAPQPNGKTGGGDALYIPCKAGVVYYVKATGGSSDLAVAVSEA